MWAARRSCLPGLRRGGGGRQAGATVLSGLVWRCELDDCSERRVQTSDSLSATVLSRRESNLHAEADRTRTGLFCRVSPGCVNWLWSGPVSSSPVWPVYWNLAISEELQSLTWTGLSVEESTRMTEDWDKWRKYAYVHGVASPRIEDG